MTFWPGIIVSCDKITKLNLRLLFSDLFKQNKAIGKS